MTGTGLLETLITVKLRLKGGFRTLKTVMNCKGHNASDMLFNGYTPSR